MIEIARLEAVAHARQFNGWPQRLGFSRAAGPPALASFTVTPRVRTSEDVPLRYRVLHPDARRAHMYPHTAPTVLHTTSADEGKRPWLNTWVHSVPPDSANA